MTMGALDLGVQNRQAQLLKNLLDEQKKTNELLAQLVASQPQHA